MKKLLILGMLFAFTAVNAQIDNDYKPYVGAGTSIQTNTQSYGAEVGIYNRNSWYALTVNSTTFSPQNEWSVGTKGYWKVSDPRTFHTVDAFVCTALSVSLTDNHPLTLEPGVAAVWNLTKRFSPQVSLGFPIRENTVFRNRPLGFSGGLSMNYWIR